MVEEEVMVVLVGRWMMSISYARSASATSYSGELLEAWRPVVALDILILSLVTVSLTVLVSVTAFLFTKISSLIYLAALLLRPLPCSTAL